MSAFEKKDPGKFTVRFNMADPQHKAVIDLLNQQGHSIRHNFSPVRSCTMSTVLKRRIYGARRRWIAQRLSASSAMSLPSSRQPLLQLYGRAARNQEKRSSLGRSQTVHCPTRAILRKMRTRRLFCKPWTLSVNNKMRHDRLEIQLVMHHSSLSATAVMKLLIISPRQQCCSGDSWDIFWFRAEKSIGGVFPNSK